MVSEGSTGNNGGSEKRSMGNPVEICTDALSIRCFKVRRGHVTNLRLASHTARELYGTKHLPNLGVDDPIRAKFMLRAHTTDSTGSSGTHQFGKTTLANLMSGEMGIIWERCKADVQTYKRLCGICRRSSKEKCCPSIGDTLFRTGPLIQPFAQEILRGSQTKKIYPLVIR